MYYGMQPLQYCLSMLFINTISNIVISLFYIVILTPKKNKFCSVGIIFLLQQLLTIIFIPHRNMITIKIILFMAFLSVFIFTKILFIDKLIKKICAVILNFLSQLLCEISASIIFLVIDLSPTSQEAATNFGMTFLIGTSLLIIFLGISAMIFNKIFKSKNTLSTDTSIVMFSASQILIPGIFAIMIFEYEIINLPILITEICVCILSLFSFIIMIYSINHMTKYEYNINLYKKYIENFYEREQTFQNQYQEIRHIKHDFNKHINTLKYLKDDQIELRNYILNLDNYISQKTSNSNNNITANSKISSNSNNYT